MRIDTMIDILCIEIKKMKENIQKIKEKIS